MSFFSDVGHFLGGVLKNPITEGIIGLTPLGPLGGLAAGALGGLIAPGGNLGGALKGGLTGGLAGEAGKVLGSGSIGNLLKDIPYLGSIFGGGGSSGNAAAGGLPTTAGGGIDWGTLLNLGQAGLGISDLVSASQLAKQSKDYANQALSSATTAYNQKQPLRQAGMAGMLNPRIQDLSGLLANSGPYGAGLPQLGSMTRTIPAPGSSGGTLGTVA